MITFRETEESQMRQTAEQWLRGRIVRVSEGSGPGSGKLFTVSSLKEKREYMQRLEFMDRDYYTLDLIRNGWIVVKDVANRFDCFPISRLAVYEGKAVR